MVFVNRKTGNGFCVRSVDSSKDQDYYFGGFNKELALTIRFLSSNLAVGTSDLNNNFFTLSGAAGISLHPHLYDSQNYRYHVPLTGNFYLYSSDFNQHTLTRLTSSDKFATDPFGGTEAAILTESLDASPQVHSISVGNTLIPTGKATISFFAKYIGREWVVVQTRLQDGNQRSGSFDIKSGSVGVVSANFTASIHNVGNSWYRCNLEFIRTNNAQHTSNFFISDADNTLIVQGDARIACHLYGLQLEQQSYSEDLPTSGSATVKKFNPFLESKLHSSFISSSVRFDATLSLYVSSSFSGALNPNEFKIDFRDGGDYSSFTAMTGSGLFYPQGDGWYKFETKIPKTTFALNDTSVQVRLSSSEGKIYSFKDVKLDFSQPLATEGVEAFRSIDNQNMDFVYINRNVIPKVDS